MSHEHNTEVGVELVPARRGLTGANAGGAPESNESSQRDGKCADLHAMSNKLAQVDPIGEDLRTEDCIVQARKIYGLTPLRSREHELRDSNKGG